MPTTPIEHHPREGDGERACGAVVDGAEPLVRTQEQLRQSQKLEEIGLLAGGLAHDFNNLLSVILSYAQLAGEDMDLADPRREDLEEVRKAGERAAELTRQLLAFSRCRTFDPRPLDLREPVRSMERMLGRLLPGRVRLAVVHGSPLGNVLADPGHAEQVLLNLAVNARDAMPGGGTLTIETSNVVLAPAEAASVGAPPGAYVALTVRDDGVGMDAETRARVFEPFFTTKEIGKGTGLGLSTVHGIVRQSGGVIRLESEPGKGTVFTIYFPDVGGTTPAVAATSLPAPALALQGTETVLVVEDEEQVLALVRTILRRAGYEVLEAQSAGDALLIVEQHAGPIDLLVTDVQMPRLLGAELARRIAPHRPSMKVLYMSGYAAAPDPGESEVAFLQKPITPDALCRKVREVLGGRR
jgi:two-component system cell cycle sensor histidine kinase/response regulator CckA